MSEIVCLGGGGGLAQLMSGFRQIGVEAAAIVAVTDSGRSTGVARALFDIPAPGDTRSVISMLAADRQVADLFEFRLDDTRFPTLQGMAFGNLIIGMLSQTTGSFGDAVEVAGRMARVSAPVLPASTENVQLVADLQDGSTVIGEVDVRGLNKPNIVRVYLDRPANALPAALDAIRKAGIVVLSPGSLYTSLLAVLAFDDLAHAIEHTPATVVMVANSTSQPGQTDAMRLVDQVHAVRTRLKGRVDAVIINNAVPPAALIHRHAGEGRTYLDLLDDERQVLQKHLTVVEADILEHASGERQLWNKADTIRHDPIKIANTILSLRK